MADNDKNPEPSSLWRDRKPGDMGIGGDDVAPPAKWGGKVKPDPISKAWDSHSADDVTMPSKGSDGFGSEDAAGWTSNSYKK